MFPIRTERDTGFINWLANAAAFSTSRGNGNESMYMKSDAIVYPDFVHFSILADVTLANNQVAIGGIHMKGPEESENELQYTLYEYNCSVWSVDPAIGLAFVTGISLATPTTSATDAIDDVRYLHLGHQQSGATSALEAEGVIALASPFDDLGAGYENRGVAFGIAAMAGLSAATAASHVQGRFSVRRLVGPLPSLLDKFKLG